MGHFWWISVPKIMYYSKMRSCLFSNLFIIKIFPYISAWYKLGVSLFDRYIPDFYLKMIRFKIPNLNFRPLSDRQMFTCDPMWIKSNKTWAFTRVRGRLYFDHFLILSSRQDERFTGTGINWYHQIFYCAHP